MRNIFKKAITIFAAGVMAVSAATLAACGNNFTPPKGNADGTVNSNGGFVVEVGDYYYFINGIENYTADNTYGSPVKGSLMRISKSGLDKNTAETVIPSLMTAGDYTSGIYIYNGRVYYATPNNVKNTSGDIEQDYLDFKSAKLDGTDIKSYMNVSSNSTSYRFVEEGGTVYLVYSESNELHSYNTSTKENVTLAKNVESYVFDRNVKGNPNIYYTMTVTMDIDVVDGSVKRDYNQIYCVRADAKKSPYEELNNYKWNEKYLEENDGEIPYHNYGTLVLDGIGTIYTENPTIFSHDIEGQTPLTTSGYTYKLQTYENGGIYFKREDLTKTGSVGEDGWLYYLSESKLESGWNSVAGNDVKNLDIVARPTDASNASSSAIFYMENGKHRYLYVKGSNIFRAEVDETGAAEVTRIAQTEGTAALVSVDTTASPYQYVYYTISGSSGNKIYRAVINGTEEQYRTLNYEASEPYRPVQILSIEAARSWYSFEIINGMLFYADAENTTSTSYNYISLVDLKNASGTLMDNVQLKAFKEEYEKTVGTDGYLAKLNSDNKKNLSTAIRYYFYTGKTNLFYDNIKEAENETGKSETLYSADEVAEFEEYVKGGNKLRSDFVKEIGQKTESDTEAIESYWQTTLQHYVAPVVEETSLPAWAWAIIGVGIGVVVIIVGVAVYLVIRSKSKDEEKKEEKMFVDTTDDKTVDVYTDMSQPEEATESEQEPATESEVEPEQEPETATEPEVEPEQEPETATEPEQAPAEESEAPSEN